MARQPTSAAVALEIEMIDDRPPTPITDSRAPYAGKVVDCQRAAPRCRPLSISTTGTSRDGHKIGRFRLRLQQCHGRRVAIVARGQHQGHARGRPPCRPPRVRRGGRARLYAQRRGKRTQRKHPRAMQLTSLADAERHIAETPVDCLAISIGTVHGRLRGAPRLDFERLSALSSALHIPLVIHGGTGLSDDQYGCSPQTVSPRSTYFTGLADAAAARSIVEEAEKRDSAGRHRTHPRRSGAVRAEVEWTGRLFGAAGRAGAASAACRRWREVEHVARLHNLRDGGQNVEIELLCGAGR